MRKTIKKRLEYFETILQLINDSYINDGYFDDIIDGAEKLLEELREYEYEE